MSRQYVRTKTIPRPLALYRSPVTAQSSTFWGEGIKESRQQVEACRYLDDLGPCSPASRKFNLLLAVGVKCNLSTSGREGGPKSHELPPFRGPGLQVKSCWPLTRHSVYELFDVCCCRTDESVEQEQFLFLGLRILAAASRWNYVWFINKLWLLKTCYTVWNFYYIREKKDLSPNWLFNYQKR